MSERLSYSLKRRDVLKLLLVGPATAVAAACGSPSPNQPGATNTTASPTIATPATSQTATNRATVTIGLTYVPNIQFAPFYVADALGYYRAMGIDAKFHHHTIGEDEFSALVAGHEDLIFAGGDETLQARGHQIDIVYVAQFFNKYPVVLIVPADSDIHSAADIKGHTVGIPGAYGATYIGLLALLNGAGLKTSDVSIQSIGFTQIPALLGHHVDAVVGYVNNEVIQFRNANFAVRTIPVSEGQPLVSNGIAALRKVLDNKPEQVRAVIKATLKGAAHVMQNPEQAVKLSAKYVPGLDDPKNAESALAVLEATIPLLRFTSKPGYTDPAAWQAMATFLAKTGQLAGPVNVSQSFSNDYLPKQLDKSFDNGAAAGVQEDGDGSHTRTAAATPAESHRSRSAGTASG